MKKKNKLIRCREFKKNKNCSYKNCTYAHTQLHFNRLPSVFSLLKFHTMSFGVLDGHLRNHKKQKIVIIKSVL